MLDPDPWIRDPELRIRKKFNPTGDEIRVGNKKPTQKTHPKKPTQKNPP